MEPNNQILARREELFGNSPKHSGVYLVDVLLSSTKGDFLFSELDPAWALKAHGLKTRRSIAGLIVHSFESEVDEPREPISPAWEDDVGPSGEGLFGLIEDPFDACLVLPHTEVERKPIDAIGWGMAGGTVESTNLAGRVVEIDEETVSAVVRRLSTAGGRRGDEFASRLRRAQFPRSQREELRPGSLFDWKIDQWIDADGSTVTLSVLSLREQRPFSAEEIREIDGRADELLGVLGESE